MTILRIHYAYQNTKKHTHTNRIESVVYRSPFPNRFVTVKTHKLKSWIPVEEWQKQKKKLNGIGMLFQMESPIINTNALVIKSDGIFFLFFGLIYALLYSCASIVILRIWLQTKTFSRDLCSLFAPIVCLKCWDLVCTISYN